MRLFLAIDLPLAVRDHLRQVQDRLRTAVDGRVAWSRPEQFHITVRFLGEQDATTCERIDSTLGKALQVPPVPMRGVGSDLLPERGMRRVIAVFFTLLDLDFRILQGIEDACVAAGLEREKRLPLLHATMGRLRPPRRMDNRAVFAATRDLFPGPEFLLDRVVLFESILLPAGAEHKKLTEYCVGAS